MKELTMLLFSRLRTTTNATLVYASCCKLKIAYCRLFCNGYNLSLTNRNSKFNSKRGIFIWVQNCRYLFSLDV